VDICVLGPVRVTTANGGQALIRHRRERAVLACLATRPRRLVLRDQLAEEIWGRGVPVAAQTTVRSYVARLRRELAPVAGSGEVAEVVATRDGGYLLDVADEHVDWLRFSRDVQSGAALLSTGQVAAARDAARRALDAWQGPPFVDLPGSPRAQELVARLDQLRLRALEVEGEAMLLAGEHQQLVPRLAGLVVEHPLEERFWEQLVRALLRCGRRAEALAMYGQAQETLEAELGVGPGPQLRAACALAHEGDAGGPLGAGPIGLLLPASAGRSAAVDRRLTHDRRRSERRQARGC